MRSVIAMENDSRLAHTDIDKVDGTYKPLKKKFIIRELELFNLWDNVRLECYCLAYNYTHACLNDGTENLPEY